MATLDLVSDASADLLVTIRDLRGRTDEYLRSACSRRRRLINVSLVGGAIATLLTSAPAFGGKPFAVWLGDLFGSSSPAWRVLCAGAALCTLAATVATQLLRSHNVEQHVLAAQGFRARLETLEIRAGLRQIGPADAVAELVRYVEDATFLWTSS